MKPLQNPRHEAFALEYAQRGNASQAYAKAGYSKTGAAQSAARLLTNAKVLERISELKAAISASTIRLAICDRNARVRVKQDRWERMRKVIEERSKDPDIAAVPGGETGLVVRSGIRIVGEGEAASVVNIYEVDTGLLRALNEVEQQAAVELGQWTEKTAKEGGAGAHISLEIRELAQRLTPEQVEAGYQQAIEQAKRLTELIDSGQPIPSDLAAELGMNTAGTKKADDQPLKDHAESKPEPVAPEWLS
jgi:hypothetical protein